MQRAGRCTPTGWVAGNGPVGSVATGPNCTWVGKRSWHGAIMLGSCARNVRAALERHSQAWVVSLLDTSPGSGALIFEDEQRSGDPDGTRASLRAWTARDTRIRLLLAQPLLYPKWSRTQRLALCRNMLVREAARLPEAGALVALDLDCRAPPAAQAAALLSSMLAERRWDVLTLNTVISRYYYDRWALRSSALTLDYDCWFNASRHTRGTCPDYAITIDATAPPFGVDSAFNGVGFYRASSVRTALAAGCGYRGTKNSYLCEHVPFHLCMRAQGMTIGVLPSVATDCGSTTVSVPARRRRIRLLANGTTTRVDPPPPLLGAGGAAGGGGAAARSRGRRSRAPRVK